MAREGLEIASRRGLDDLRLHDGRQRRFVRPPGRRVGVGDGARSRSGWTNEITGGFYLELYVDRAVLRALRGGDPVRGPRRGRPAAAVDGRATRSTRRTSTGVGPGQRSPPAGSPSARSEADASADLTNYFLPDQPAPRRAGGALGRRRGGGRERSCRPPRRARSSGARPIGLDGATLRAGLAALEGRRAEAIAGYREALRGWRAARAAPSTRRMAGARHGDPARPDRARDGRGVGGDRVGPRDPDPARRRRRSSPDWTRRSRRRRRTRPSRARQRRSRLAEGRGRGR